MANNFTSSNSLSSSAKENIVRSMQDVFSHLDPEVIYIVLSECDFKGNVKTLTLSSQTHYETPRNANMSNCANQLAS